MKTLKVDINKQIKDFSRLLDMVRSIFSYSSLLASFWGYALETIIYLLNRVSFKSVHKTSYEMWKEIKPVLNHIRIWACPTHVFKGKTTKLESRTHMCLFVGYLKGTRGYYFYNNEEQKVFVSINAKFLEEDYMKDYKPKSKIELKELSQDDINPSLDDRIEKALRKENSHKDQQLLETRRK